MINSGMIQKRIDPKDKSGRLLSLTGEERTCMSVLRKLNGLIKECQREPFENSSRLFAIFELL
jgi:DNA-binding MarR family transcriptional regulator